MLGVVLWPKGVYPVSKKVEEVGNQEVGNHKDGPKILFDVGGEEVLLRPYTFGWEICYKRKMKDELIWTGEKYFGNLASAMNAMFEYKLRASDANNLAELRDRVLEIREELTEVWNTTLKETK